MRDPILWLVVLIRAVAILDDSECKARVTIHSEKSDIIPK